VAMWHCVRTSLAVASTRSELSGLVSSNFFVGIPMVLLMVLMVVVIRVIEVERQCENFLVDVKSD